MQGPKAGGEVVLDVVPPNRPENACVINEASANANANANADANPDVNADANANPDANMMHEEKQEVKLDPETKFRTLVDNPPLPAESPIVACCD